MKRTGIKNRQKEKNRGLPSLTKPTLFFILLVIVGIIGMIIVIFYVDKETNLEFDEEAYQYFSDSTEPFVYHDGAVISNSEMATIIRQDDGEHSVDPTPFYSYSTSRIYLPKSYSWLCFDDNSYWRIPEFTSLTYSNNVCHCKLNNITYDISSGFLFDNDCNYVFLENGSLSIDGQKFNLGPLSFYSQDHGVIRVFDYANKDLTVIYDNVKSALFTFDAGYKVELRRGTMTTSNGVQTLLPGSPTYLDNVESRGE